jgi:hypothetical protein
LFELAAFSSANFDELLQRTGGTATEGAVTSFGKTIDRYRILFLRLSTGAFAAVSKYDSQTESEIGLQPDGDWFSERDLAAVMEFTGWDQSQVRKYRTPTIGFR